jgi:hypothetical protein
MPLNKKAIRIIKREERDILTDQSETPSLLSRTEKQHHREILKTVTFWIEQQRERKQLEWRVAFDIARGAK